MKELKDNATLEEQRTYYQEQSVDFALQYINLLDKYNHDVTLLMFMVAEYIPFFEDMLSDLGMEDVLNDFKEKRSVQKALKDYNIPTTGGEL